jgi:hypothetical protein
MMARPPLLVSHLAATLACAALWGNALAQNVPALPPAQTLPPQAVPVVPATPAIPQYQVEVLVFAYREFDRSEEQFSHETSRVIRPRGETLRAPPVFDDSNFGPLAQNSEQPGQPPPFGADAPVGQDTAAAEQNEFRFRLLRPEELQLTTQFRVLERNAQAYVPLLHGGWVQPGLPENESRPFDLAMFGAKNPMGTIRLYLSRFLHVKVDLSYRDPAAATAAPAFGNELAEVPIAPRYYLVADRPTRSGELHYFDHPAFGVLIKVTPVRPEQAQPGTPGAPGTRPAA